MGVQLLNRETDGTLTLMRSLPPDHYDCRPDAGGRSIGELALHLSEIEAYVSRGIERSEFRFEPPQVERPTTIEALTPVFLAVHEDARARIARLQAGDLEREIRFADGELWSIRNLLWRRLLMHAVHHRGQLTLLVGYPEASLRVVRPHPRRICRASSIGEAQGVTAPWPTAEH